MSHAVVSGRALSHLLNGQDQLVLASESPATSVLDSATTSALRLEGGIIFCEDDASDDGDGHPLALGITDVNRLVGIGLSQE